MYWQRLVGPSIATIQVLIVLLYPFVWVSQMITRWLRPSTKMSILTCAEIRNVAQTGLRDGILRSNEHDIINNLMRFTEVETKTIMIPRGDIIAVDADLSISHYGSGHPSHTVSRIPLATGTTDGELNLDAIDGYLLKDELLAALLDRSKHHIPAKKFRRPMIRIDGVTKLPQLYDRLIEANEHIAIVTEPSTHANHTKHAVIGLVTMEDLIEELLGLEIEDEDDALREKFQEERRKKQSDTISKVPTENPSGSNLEAAPPPAATDASLVPAPQKG